MSVENPGAPTEPPFYLLPAPPFLVDLISARSLIRIAEMALANDAASRKVPVSNPSNPVREWIIDSIRLSVAAYYERTSVSIPGDVYLLRNAKSGSRCHF